MKTLKQVLRRNFDTVGGAVVAALTETEANYAQVAEAVREKMNSATSRESVRYYATQLRKEGGGPCPSAPAATKTARRWGLPSPPEP